jgi:hypothetical protein
MPPPAAEAESIAFWIAFVLSAAELVRRPAGLNTRVAVAPEGAQYLFEKLFDLLGNVPEILLEPLGAARQTVEYTTIAKTAIGTRSQAFPDFTSKAYRMPRGPVLGSERRDPVGSVSLH